MLKFENFMIYYLMLHNGDGFRLQNDVNECNYYSKEVNKMYI